MTRRTAANRYAKALLDVALKESDPVQVERDLSGFAALVSQHPTLARVMMSPAVPTARKHDLVKELVARLPEMSPIVGKILLLMAQRDRLMLLDDLVEAYRERLMDHQQVVRARVTSAVALPDGQREALAKSLGVATGRRVELTSHVDPAIIGGIVARVGSVVYDGSVTRQLARMKEKLLEGA